MGILFVHVQAQVGLGWMTEVQPNTAQSAAANVQQLSHVGLFQVIKL